MKPIDVVRTERRSDLPIASFRECFSSVSRPGFTLVEMLVVIGIIAILIGASIGGYAHMTKLAEKAKAQELVSNVATALTALFQREGCWPMRLLEKGKTDGELDEKTALALAKGGYFSLSTDNPSNPQYATKLVGHDRFGIVDPWAAAILKRKGAEAKEADVRDGDIDRRLHFALDLDGDGIIVGASVGGQAIDVRATAIVWCGGKDGVIDPYPYASGGGEGKKGASANKKAGTRSDDVYSWTPAQTKDVK